MALCSGTVRGGLGSVALPELVRGRNRRAVASSDRRLPIYETDHVVAAGVARPHLQLGRSARLCGASRTRLCRRPRPLRRLLFLDAGIRHDLRPPGCGGRRSGRGEIHRPAVRTALAHLDLPVLCDLLCLSCRSGGIRFPHRHCLAAPDPRGGPLRMAVAAAGY